MDRTLSLRMFYDLLLVALFVWAPWWLTFLWAALGAFLFPSFCEILLVGAAYDLLYAPPDTGIVGGWFLVGSGAALIGHALPTRVH